MPEFSLFTAAAEAPDRPALLITGPGGADRLETFGSLVPVVAKTVRWLEGQLEEASFEDGPRVAVVGANRFETAVALYALMELGVTAVLVHPRLTPPERRRLREDCRPALWLDEHWQLPEGENLPAELLVPETRPVSEDACLAILYTSGTSGRPKGAMLSRGAFRAAAAASAANLGWRPDERWLLAMPLAHVGGLSILTRCLAARSCAVLETAERFEPRAVAETLERCRVSLASFVPTMLARMARLEPPWQPPAALRAILLGGAAASPALLAEAADRGWPVLTTYGCTEACSQVTTQAPGTVNRGQLGAGRPLAGVEVRIAEEGGIEVRGPNLMQGYFPPDGSTPFETEGWFATGDLGRLDAAGNLHVLGRRGDLLITGGENVYPAEVEHVLESHPAIAAACVFGVEDESWGQVVAAALVPADAGSPLPDDQLAVFCAAHLARHKLPRRVAWLDALEVNAAGKLDREATRRRAEDRLRPLA